MAGTLVPVRFAISALLLLIRACFHWGKLTNFGSSSETLAHCSTSLNTGACKVTPSCFTSLFGWSVSDIFLFTISGAFLAGGCEGSVFVGTDCFRGGTEEGLETAGDDSDGAGRDGAGRDGAGWDGADTEGDGREGAGREGAGREGAGVTLEGTAFGAGASGATSSSTPKVDLVLVMAGLGPTKDLGDPGRNTSPD